MLQLDKESLGRLSRAQLSTDNYPGGLSTADDPTDHTPFPLPVGVDLPRQALSCCRRSCG